MEKFSPIIITLTCMLCLCGLAAAQTAIQGLQQRAPLDFDGDNRTDYVVLRNSGSSGRLIWYLQQSTQGFSAQQWGLFDTDFFVPGDYDGDGKTDQAVWRPGTPATFYVNRSSAGFEAFQFGTKGDTAGAWLLLTE